jgi:AraC family transcriptional regulator
MRKSIPVTTGSAQLVSMEASGFQVTETRFPPQLSLASHYHERACVSVILEGVFDESMGGRTYELPPLSILAKPAGERHSDRFLRAGARVLIIEPDHLEADRLSPYVNVFDSVNCFQDYGVAGVAWRIVRELHSPDAITPLAVDGLVLELLAVAARRDVPSPTKNRPPPWLAQAQEFLQANFTRPLRVADLAAEVGVHPVHLARVFRAHFGASPASYVRRLRLEWSGMQLSTSNRPLSELALEAGFADQSHFNRTFKRHTGLTPEQYRQATGR